MGYFLLARKIIRIVNFFWLSFICCVVCLLWGQGTIWVITLMIMGTLMSTGVGWREQCWWYPDSMSRSWCRAVITQVVTWNSRKSLQAPCLPDYGRSSNFTKMISSSNVLSHSVAYSSLLVFSTSLLLLCHYISVPCILNYPTWILLPTNKIGHQNYWPFQWLNDADIWRRKS